MNEIQKKIIELLIGQLPQNIEENARARKANKFLTSAIRLKYIGSDKAMINSVCNAVMYTMRTEDPAELFDYFKGIPEKNHFFRAIRKLSESVLHEQIIKFLEEHPLINVTGLERVIDAPASTIAGPLSTPDKRTIPARYFPQLIQELKAYGFEPKLIE